MEKLSAGKEIKSCGKYKICEVVPQEGKKKEKLKFTLQPYRPMVGAPIGKKS